MVCSVSQVSFTFLWLLREYVSLPSSWIRNWISYATFFFWQIAVLNPHVNEFYYKYKLFFEIKRKRKNE